MGLGSDAIELLIRLKSEGLIAERRSVIEIGAQQLANSFLAARDWIEDIGQLFATSARCPLFDQKPTQIVHGGLEHLAADAPSASEFWVWLGFDYAAIDIDGSPCSIPLDLNHDRAPRRSVGKYDLVTNFGTTEHVANQLNAFEIIHDLTALDGLMIHSLPMQGMLNHGLVNYNPKFFWMLARSNGYRVVYMNLTGGGKYNSLPQNILEAVIPFEPDIMERQEKFCAADMGLVFVLQKAFDTPFVAPLDVSNGTRAAYKALETRYWTVFKTDAFQNLAEVRPPSRWARRLLDGADRALRRLR